MAAGQMAVGGVDVLFNLGADEIEIAPGPFVIYQGTHGDRGAHRADVILPGGAYPEKSGTYVNTEGRVQMANRATFPPGDAREDWAILRALSDALGKRLPFDNLQALRRLMYEAHPHLAQLETVVPADGAAALAALAGLSGTPSRDPFVSPVRDFFLTNPIARASRVMAECSALHRGAPALQAAE
jgi:NADH-quinone oxidoreductase subunit G